MPLVLAGVFATEDPEARHGHHRRERARRRRSSPSASRCRAAPSCTRCTRPRHASIAAARSNPCSCPRRSAAWPCAAAPPPGRRPRQQRSHARTHAQARERRSGRHRPDHAAAAGVRAAARCAASGCIRAPTARRSRGWACAPGDLVTAINGTPLDDQDRAQEIFGTLSSSTDARVTRHAQRTAAGSGAQHRADRGRGGAARQPAAMA